MDLIRLLFILVGSGLAMFILNLSSLPYCLVDFMPQPQMQTTEMKAAQTLNQIPHRMS